jgi:hypothetical protein
MATALLIVPPFLKHASGPLLGPAMLLGAAAEGGHRAQLVDLNARWIARDLSDAHWTPSAFVGDHDRDERLLRESQARFRVPLGRISRDLGIAEDDLFALRLDHDDASRSAARIAEEYRDWIVAQLHGIARPDLVGISVLFSGQVLWAMAVRAVVASIWPGVPTVWGGAHVTALADEIAHDRRYAVAADGFVAGYAEQTFVELLDALDTGRAWPRACFTAGSGAAPRACDNGRVVAQFHDVHLPRGAPLTLPAQRSRGCVYGKCTYCTYPTIEGRFRPLDGAPSAAVVTEAVQREARVSFKDSLLTAPLLREIAEMIGGRVRWSACTKLSRALSPAVLRALGASGCATLEIGLETLADDAQTLIHKRQPTALFLDTLDAAAGAGIALVVNYMTGFPGIDRDAELRGLEVLHRAIDARPLLVVKVEHNRFELERLAPLAQNPPKGVRVTGAWPWSSVLTWTGAPSPQPRRLPVLA